LKIIVEGGGGNGADYCAHDGEGAGGIACGMNDETAHWAASGKKFKKCRAIYG